LARPLICKLHEKDRLGLNSNTLLSVDIAAAQDLVRVVRPRAQVPPPRQAAVQAPVSVRTCVGRCLLHLPRVVWMCIDVLLVCTGTALGDQWFVWWGDAGPLFVDHNLLLANIVLAPAVLLSASVFGLYESKTLWARSRIVARCLLTVSLAILATWLIMHLFMYSTLSRRVALSGVVFYLLTGSAVRLVAHRAVRDVRRGLLVIGQGPLTGSIVRSIRRQSVWGYQLVGVVNTGSANEPRHGVSDIPTVGEISEVVRLCREHNVAEIVVAESCTRNPRSLRTALACLRLGCRVTDETTFYESMFGEVPVSHITPRWFLVADLKGHLGEHAVWKRMFDIVVAGLGLVISAPISLLAALAIRLEGGGPAIYMQTRVGKNGRPFTLYKFRTMGGNAESNGTTWAVRNDPRVTRVGRLLRRTRLDELPQLWNILKGDMSVVGPRPERPEFVEPLSALIPYYEERHLIKPGLTGWAQINYPYGASIADARRKLQLDLYYIKQMSLELDLVILLRTFGTFFLGSR